MTVDTQTKIRWNNSDIAIVASMFTTARVGQERVRVWVLWPPENLSWWTKQTFMQTHPEFRTSAEAFDAYRDLVAFVRPTRSQLRGQS
jgi:hypothetical protein